MPEASVIIECVFYDGVVFQTEADEYVQLTNLGNAGVELAGWRLRDISDGLPTFTFPSYMLQSGAKVRVYTNQDHPEWGGFSFGFRRAIWDNDKPDTAALFDPQGQEVSRRSYPPGCPKG